MHINPTSRGWPKHGAKTRMDAKNTYECHDKNVAALGEFGALRDKGRG
jgi:hypothetical protein